ncbi:uncharacterized protein LOC129002107 [Macrosteles quadrilineatus]|uniref:uncharacterized protein LOC129002107 n=1 Tax=Macrosteles quadrilineatus TaxID=74068 RepID=UPI0023E10060|nr:uncharacterized protein LOC129002107 [Macrosteles quadrilineatus]
MPLLSKTAQICNLGLPYGFLVLEYPIYFKNLETISQRIQNETEEEREARRNRDRIRHVQRKENETEEERDARRCSNRIQQVQKRGNETEVEREARRNSDRILHVRGRENETEEEQEARRESDRILHVQRRENETDEKREARRNSDRIIQVRKRENETEEEQEARRESDRKLHVQRRENETDEEREARRNSDRIRHVRKRENETEEEQEARRNNDRILHVQRRENETEEEQEARRESDRILHVQRRENETVEEGGARRNSDRILHVRRRENETREERESRQERDRVRQNQRRNNETPEEREARHIIDNDRYRRTVEEQTLLLHDEATRVEELRASQDIADRNARVAADSERHRVNRVVESDAERQTRIARERTRHVERNLTEWRDTHNSGFQYDPFTRYSEAANIGDFDKVCRFCHALSWSKEPRGICCASGKVSIPSILEAPEPLRTWISDESPQSRNFLRHIRAYNSAFQMTSFGGNEIREGPYMPTFKVQGQVYHLIGSLLPPPGLPPSYLQIYFVGDDQVQLQRRQSLFQDLDHDMLAALQNMLQNNNAYLLSFKTTLETFPVDSPDFKIVIRADRRPAGDHPGRYNEPTVNEVAILMIGDPSDHRDIILNSREQGLKRIYETHRSYDALQYPLMFCRGEDGYSFNLYHVNPVTKQPTTKKTSSREFYAYRIMVREGEANHIHKFKQLLNQYLVDMYAKVESERLLYLRTHQKELRAENYIHLQDALRRDDNVEEMGQKIILPATFTGGPRYMHSRTQDAFCYVRKFGRPELFITMTTNPKWIEITSVIGERQSAHDRYDVVSRVFHLKLNCMIAVLMKGQIYGSVRCYMYSVEWQKRGLPHAHILIWLEESIPPNRIDQVISAELPNPETDPELADIVKTHMLHGPCGAFNVRQRKLPCMKDGHCSKRYPRPFVNETATGDNGYPTYRRRSPDDGGHHVLIRVGNDEIPMDNRWVVPYSPVLSRTFLTHVNVEYCSSVKSIKYICKYINKGSDQATFAVSNDTDEIKMYQSGRYICTSEAVWRILSFPIHERFTAVLHLEVHLPNEQRVYFQPGNVRERMDQSTTLLAFFNLCQTDAFSRTLLYNELPYYYTYSKQRGWSRRRRGQPVPGHPDVRQDPCIGRVYTVHPSCSERYHLRLLLHTVRGPTSFEDLKTVDGVLHPNFQSACRALGLLEDDACWEGTLAEAAVSDSPTKLRDLFSVLLVFCNVSNPLELWIRFRDSLSEDFLRSAHQVDINTTFENNPIIYDQCLASIQETITRMGGLGLESYNLPVPAIDVNQLNHDYIRETSYDHPELIRFIEQCTPTLNEEQRQVYEQVLTSINGQRNKMFFLDAPGGTGKTYLIKLILAKVRSNSKIALAVASSGIAATLLPGGRTAHSMFKIPINVEHMDIPICSISKSAPMARVLQAASLIVWDECTMSNKLTIEALDRTLKDMRNSNKIMGGVTVLFSGDFRQTLPVVVRGTRADEINASMKRSTLWPIMNKLALTKNMRANIGNEVEEFSNVLLKLGDGKLGNVDGTIDIPPSLGVIVQTQDELIEKVYPGIEDLPNKSSAWLCNRAILTPKNEVSTKINKKVMSLFLSEDKTYLSVNTVLRNDDAVHYPAEFLDSVTAPGLPAHELNLKIGIPVMLLRNLNPPKLCNGTRLRIRSLQRNVIEAEILTGCGAGEVVFVPRIPLIPSNYPFEFKRLQFPLNPCFSMTINKSQGQTLSTAGIELGDAQCFSHGQLYVACSRVRSPTNLYIHAPGGRTTNIVYEEALS